MAFMEPGQGREHRIALQEAYDYVGKHYDVETNDPQLLDPAPEGSLLQVEITGCHCLLIEPWVLLVATGVFALKTANCSAVRGLPVKNSTNSGKSIDPSLFLS